MRVLVHIDAAVVVEVKWIHKGEKATEVAEDMVTHMLKDRYLEIPHLKLKSVEEKPKPKKVRK